MTGRADAKAATEPWMRGDHLELDALRRGVVHALELALEDADRWTANLTDTAMEARPAGLPSVGFHLRHIARSLDRLLTYAEGRALSQAQLNLLQTEATAVSAAATIEEFRLGLSAAMERVVSHSPEEFEQPRGIGRLRLPTTVGGLLVHCAEHTQRHSGQMVTTAKLVLAEDGPPLPSAAS